jgi:hypothetical protein
MQDIEFTVEDAKLHFLQARAGKRTPRAALKIAVDLVREGVIDEAEALRRVGNVDPTSAVITRFAGAAKAIAAAIPASTGVVTGRITFDSTGAAALATRGTQSSWYGRKHRPRISWASVSLYQSMKKFVPVRFPPGLPRLATSPNRTGSPPTAEKDRNFRFRGLRCQCR